MSAGQLVEQATAKQVAAVIHQLRQEEPQLKALGAELLSLNPGLATNPAVKEAITWMPRVDDFFKRLEDAANQAANPPA